MTTFTLRLLSVGYLLLSTLLFLQFWFRPELSFVFLAGHTIYFFWYVVQKPQQAEVGIPVKHLLFLAAAALIWTLSTGNGGVFQQTTDFYVHNTKFNELFINKWPMRFEEKKSFSCYYYGYYLVPSFIFKIVGEISDVVIIVYTWIGFFLGMSWLYLLLSRNILKVMVLIMVGGLMFNLEILSLSLFKTSFSQNPLLSIFIQSLYVPNQIISVLITTGILLYYIKDYRLAYYPITISFLWGVFPALILTIVIGIIFCIDFVKKERISFRSLISDYILPSFFFLPTFIYLLSSDQMPISGFYDFDEPGKLYPFIDMMLLAIVVVVLARTSLQKTNEHPVPFQIVLISLILLTALLTYRIGIYNDLYLRGSMPLLIIILTFIFQKLEVPRIMGGFSSKTDDNSSKPSPFFGLPYKYLFIYTLLVISMVASFYQLSKQAKTNKPLGNYNAIEYSTFPNSYQVLLHIYGDEGANQYLGDSRSFYYLHLAPK